MAAVNITSGVYDFTNTTTAGNVFEFVKEVNNLTDGYFMLGVLIAGWIVLFVSMMDYGNKPAITASSFIISVMAILFSTMDLVRIQFVIIILIIFMILFTVLSLRRDA